MFEWSIINNLKFFRAFQTAISIYPKGNRKNCYVAPVQDIYVGGQNK